MVLSRRTLPWQDSCTHAGGLTVNTELEVRQGAPAVASDGERVGEQVVPRQLTPCGRALRTDPGTRDNTVRMLLGLVSGDGSEGTEVRGGEVAECT